jgi:hypothetical protein
MAEPHDGESFEDFKNSFSYGSRSDLNFKFLKNLSSDDAAHFFQGLLWQLGDSLVDGDLNRITEYIYQAQAMGYAGPGRYVYDDAPFTPLRAPVSQLNLALLTSSGHFVTGDDPKPFGLDNMTQQDAEARIDDFLKEEPQLSSIPLDTPEDKLRVRHGGYDVRAAQADPNVNFPLTRLRELQQAGLIGNLVSPAYSFVGACSQARLLRHAGPEWVGRFKDADVDAALLVPV